MTDFDFGQFRALVVEDNDFVRFVVKKHLSDFGFKNIDEAANGEEGVAQLKNRPDIIVCDINMAPMNGFEFAKHVRSLNDGGFARLPIIFLTGNADSTSVRKAVDIEVDAYLLKPVMPDRLREKIITLMTRMMTA